MQKPWAQDGSLWRFSCFHQSFLLWLIWEYVLGFFWFCFFFRLDVFWQTLLMADRSKFGSKVTQVFAREKFRKTHLQVLRWKRRFGVQFVGFCSWFALHNCNTLNKWRKSKACALFYFFSLPPPPPQHVARCTCIFSSLLSKGFGSCIASWLVNQGPWVAPALNKAKFHFTSPRSDSSSPGPDGVFLAGAHCKIIKSTFHSFVEKVDLMTSNLWD